MNKGTAIVGFLLSFLAGMGLMWGIAHDHGVDISAEVASKGGGSGESHAGSPIPITADDPVWGKNDAPVTIVEISAVPQRPEAVIEVLVRLPDPGLPAPLPESVSDHLRGLRGHRSAIFRPPLARV
jgi:hypothetical protein